MREHIIEAIKQKAIRHGKVELASGKVSDYYINLTNITMHSNYAYLIAELILNTVNLVNRVWGGPATGAIPIICALSHTMDGGGFYVQKKNNKYSIEGCLEKGAYVLMIEDVTTTGKSLLNAIEVVENYGCKVVEAITVVDRNEGAKELFASKNIPFKALISHEELLDK